ncbi:hypothetical protein IWW36_004864, partial [Coemansia brasiliensis]
QPDSYDSNGSFSSETAHLSPASVSTPASVTSYHTANGTFSDEPDSHHATEFNRDASVRIKVDPNTLHDSLYEDIFSDEDDGVVQMEPSFCHSGAGLSDSSQPPSPEKPQHIVSSSESIDMQSLSNAMAQTKLNDAPVASQTAISAFPVMISNMPSQPIVDSTSKPVRSIDQLKQETNGTKGNQQARASSPFMLRDSLYEMIMGRSNSRSSMSSIGSVNSNALSNTSTVNVSKEQQQQQQQQQQQASQPRSPTSPTSHTSHVSPTSTTFDESNASASQTAISSPTENTSFNTVIKSSAPQVPEAVPEEEAVPESLPPRPMLNPEDYSDSEGSSYSNSDDSHHGSHQNVGFDSHSSGPEVALRPTAASLFAPEQDGISEEPITAYATAETSPANAESTEPANSMHSTSSFRAGRIGRRLGRETVDLMLDEDTSSTAEKFDIMSSKMVESTELLGAPEEPMSKTSSEESSALEVSKLPSDVPLTREKRDQYLQTLISRNTMRGGSPNKRSAMALAMRSASPAPASASDAASSAGEDDSDWHSPSRTQTFRQRHLSKRSESGIDFSGTRSPSSSGLRDRVWDPESLQRPSSSLHIREALSVSGASINGRMRANTINDANSPEAEVSSAARKVSPSLSSLKTRNLVSSSPAKSLESHNASPKWSLSQHLKQSESRTRAMSTPIDAQPPLLRLESTAAEGSTVRSNASTARIGRVAALSQNFERQQDQSIPRVVIPMRTAAHYDPLDKGEAVSAPLNKNKHKYQRPATRSNSISSSHSAGGHGQATVASSGGKDKDTSSMPSGNSPASKGNNESPIDDNNADDGAGGDGSGGNNGAGNSGGNNGDDDSSSNGKP